MNRSRHSEQTKINLLQPTAAVSLFLHFSFHFTLNFSQVCLHDLRSWVYMHCVCLLLSVRVCVVIVAVTTIWEKLLLVCSLKTVSCHTIFYLNCNCSVSKSQRIFQGKLSRSSCIKLNACCDESKRVIRVVLNLNNPR